MIELLAPAGNFEKLKTALHFGADAVYLAGKEFGLRAYADNFSLDELREAVEYAHTMGRRVYVTVNIFANNNDFDTLPDYLRYLEGINADGIIVADLGVLSVARSVAPNLPVHISTQANITNSHAAAAYVALGAEQLVLARELSLDAIREIKKSVPVGCKIECFVHGAMCVSMSGRCLLSNFLSHRDGNRGECIQACRWEYKLVETGREDSPLLLSEDKRAAYILNSKDLNMLSHIDKLIDAGIDSFKIEGRMKSAYYVATVVNAYRRMIDSYLAHGDMSEAPTFEAELQCAYSRDYTTGFYFGGTRDTMNYANTQRAAAKEFVAQVVGYDAERGMLIVEQRNRFSVGAVLEVLSSGDCFGAQLHVTEMFDATGKPVTDAKLVQQILYIPTGLKLEAYDILRSTDL